MRSAPALALALAGAAMLAGCGGGSAAGPRTGSAPAGGAGAATRVTLRLKAAEKTPAAACGSTHRTASYKAGASIRFGGTVVPVPSGPYKVRVKVKVCRGRAFTPVAEVKAVLHRRQGTFTGVLPRLPAGSYAARALLRVGTARVARSEKRHFVIG